MVWREKMVQAPGSCAPSWQFYRDVGRKLDPGRYPDFKDPEDLYRRFSALVPSWKGMTLERLRESPDGLVWPLYSLEDKERTGSVFAEGKLLTPSGKMKAVDTLFGRFPQWDYPKGSPLGKDRSDDFPLVLTQGKQLWHWQQTLQGRRTVLERAFHLPAPRDGAGARTGAGGSGHAGDVRGRHRGLGGHYGKRPARNHLHAVELQRHHAAAGEPERAHQQHTPQLLGPHFLPAQRRRLPAAQAGVRASMTA